MRLTIEEYAKRFKMSKEMIYSKLRDKKLNYIIDDGTTYIIIKDEEKPQEPQQTSKNSHINEGNTNLPAKPKMTVAMVLALYQRENKQLKEKIVQLENKIDKLINDKEQMLRDERDRIEDVYNAKDEQLKKILELINTKLMLENPGADIHEVQTFKKLEKEKEIENATELVELRDYLDTLDLKSPQKKMIKKRFLNVHDSDIRIIQQNGKLYLDFSKYDYSDLFAF